AGGQSRRSISPSRLRRFLAAAFPVSRELVGAVILRLRAALGLLAIGLELLAQGVLLLRQLRNLLRGSLLGLLSQLDRLVEDELDLGRHQPAIAQRILFGTPDKVAHLAVHRLAQLARQRLDLFLAGAAFQRLL